MNHKKKPMRRSGARTDHRKSTTGGGSRHGSGPSRPLSRKTSSKKNETGQGTEAARGAIPGRPADKGRMDSGRGETARTALSKQGSESERPKTDARRPPKGPPVASSPTLGSVPKRKRAAASDAEEKDDGAMRTDAAAAASASGTSQQRDVTYDQTAESDSSFDDGHFAESFPNPVDVGMLGIGSPFYLPDVHTHPDDDEPLPESGGSGSLADDPSVEMRIREIEERLDGLMASAPHDDLDNGPAPEPEAVAPTTADTAVNAAREVLESEYYRQKWGRGSLRARSQEVDEFGMDPDYEQKFKPLLEFLFKRYFRVEVEGVRNVPSEGRAVIVANHSGTLPFDGVMLREAIRERHSGRSDFRWLAEDFTFYLPFLGVTFNRLGAVRACPENAERLLSKDHLVGVFPEGAEGIKKLYKNRYNLQRFGRGGFIRLCLKTHSPIVPCAIVGAEETNPILYRFDNLSKLLGLDYLPITPTFPLLGPLGLLPAPTKWKIVFGEPIPMDEYGPQAEKDHVLVGRLAERVRSQINDLLETSLRRRKSIWL